MKNAPIAVVIPCYCCADVLMRAIDSVLNQTLLPAEIVLIDDASTDNGATRACIENIASDVFMNSLLNIRVCYLTENLGAGETRNVAMNLSSQPILAFLDSDDAWVPDKLLIQYYWMLNHPEFTITCHKKMRLGFSSDLRSQASVIFFEIGKMDLIFRNSIQTSSVMMLNVTDRRFPKAMRYAEDYWLWLHLKFKGERIACINSELSLAYKNVYGESGLSANLYKMHKGVLRCFSDLRTARQIGIFIYLVACSYEIIKYFFRVVVTSLKKN